MTHYHFPDGYLHTGPYVKFGLYNFKDKGVATGGWNPLPGLSQDLKPRVYRVEEREAR